MDTKDVKCGETDYVEEFQDTSDIQFEAGEEKKLVRKIDLFLMPTIWLMYLLSYMDRTNIGNAKIAGMNKDLGLSDSQYSMALVIFFISYVFFEVPSNMILAKTRPSIFLPTIMALWGIVTCCMAVIHDYSHLLALRFVVGVLESGFAPGILLIISSWYKKEEQSKRFAVYISAAVLSGAFGGILAGSITRNLDGAHGIEGWRLQELLRSLLTYDRWLFIVEGAATVGWAICAHFLLLDFPSQTSKRFTERELLLANQRLALDNTSPSNAEGHRPKISSFKALIKAVSDWRTWIMVAGYMVIVGSSTLSYFYPTLVQGLGYTSVKAQYMVVPIYAVSFVAVVCSGIIMDRYHQYRGFAIAGWLSLSTICAIVVCVVYNFTARYVLLIFLASGLWASNALGLSYASSTFCDMEQETKGVALALVNALGNLASIYGAYLFPHVDAPKYLKGFGVVSGMCGLGVMIYIAAHILLKKR
ncbi:MFS general substrate transporter [Aureobasidium subglaciale]|nr:MFS general substrate transporter [Aureobasidium subglaciale]